MNPAPQLLSARDIRITPDDVRSETRRLVEALEAEDARVRWLFEQAPEPPPPPPEPDPDHNFLTWEHSDAVEAPPETVPIEDIWADDVLFETMADYCRDPNAGHVLGVLAKAGTGKTDAGVRLAQWAAKQGRRVLWCAPAHRSYAEIETSREYDPRLWYAWKPIDDETCRFVESQREWMRRGQSSYQLCWQICGKYASDPSAVNHIGDCDYRRQADTTAPIIFAMHNHLSSGLSVKGFDLVIIDENPIAPFVSLDRVIPRDGVASVARGYFRKIADKLVELIDDVDADPNSEGLRGRELFEHLAPLLDDVYAQVERGDLSLVTPDVPRVRRPEDVSSVAWNFALDFLRLARAETAAFFHGWQDWASRVRITPRTERRRAGLQLIDRSEPWEHLPPKVVALDATGSAPVYRSVLRRPMKVFRPPVAMKAKLYQVTAALFGAGSVTDQNDAPTDHARKLLRWSVEIAAKYDGDRVGVITHKSIRPIFDDVFGKDNVMHFGNLRGSRGFEANDDAGVEAAVAVIVAGTPGVPPWYIEDVTIALNPERIAPLSAQWTHERRPFRISRTLSDLNDGRTPFRIAGGYWGDDELQNVYEQFRRAELEQALHRARGVSQPVDVYLLSSMPTDEYLDGIGDRPSGNGTRSTQYESNLPDFGPPDIPWAIWSRLRPFLDDCHERGQVVGRLEMSEALNRSEAYVRTFIRAIWKYYGAGDSTRWSIVDDPSFEGKRGPRVQALKPITVD